MGIKTTIRRKTGRVRRYTSEIVELIRETWGLLLLILAVLLTIGLIAYGVAHNDVSKNCKRTEETRILYITSGKVMVPIIQHKYVCTYEEWH